MCEALINEFAKFKSSLNDNDLNYIKEAETYHVKNFIGYHKHYYEWKKTDQATFYKRYEDIYEITATNGYSAPRIIVKLPIKKRNIG